MAPILSILLILSTSVLAQTPITLSTTSATLSPINRETIFTPQIVGGVQYPNVILPTPVACWPSNGIVNTNLLSGFYSISFIGWPRTLHVFVPDLWVTNLPPPFNTLPVNLALPNWQVSGGQLVFIQTNFIIFTNTVTLSQVTNFYFTTNFINFTNNFSGANDALITNAVASASAGVSVANNVATISTNYDTLGAANQIGAALTNSIAATYAATMLTMAGALGLLGQNMTNSLAATNAATLATLATLGANVTNAIAATNAATLAMIGQIGQNLTNSLAATNAATLATLATTEGTLGANLTNAIAATNATTLMTMAGAIGQIGQNMTNAIAATNSANLTAAMAREGTLGANLTNAVASTNAATLAALNTLGLAATNDVNALGLSVTNAISSTNAAALAAAVGFFLNNSNRLNNTVSNNATGVTLSGAFNAQNGLTLPTSLASGTGLNPVYFVGYFGTNLYTLGGSFYYSTATGLNFAGPVWATCFYGNASGLSGITGPQLAGPYLPPVATNGGTGYVFPSAILNSPSSTNPVVYGWLGMGSNVVYATSTNLIGMVWQGAGSTYQQGVTGTYTNMDDVRYALVNAAGNWSWQSNSVTLATVPSANLATNYWPPVPPGYAGASPATAWGGTNSAAGWMQNANAHITGSATISGSLTVGGSFTGNNFLVQTNAFAPAPVAWTGNLWNSNNALYWVTTSHTNYLTGP